MTQPPAPPKPAFRQRLATFLTGGLCGALLAALIGLWTVDPVRGSVCRKTHISFGCDDKYKTVNLKDAQQAFALFLTRATGSGDATDAWVMLDPTWQEQFDETYKAEWLTSWTKLFYAELAGPVQADRGYNRFSAPVRLYLKGPENDPYNGTIDTFTKFVELRHQGSDIQIARELGQNRGPVDPVAHRYPRLRLIAYEATRVLPRHDSPPTLRPGIEYKVGGQVTALCEVEVVAGSTERLEDVGRWTRIPQGYVPSRALEGGKEGMALSGVPECASTPDL